jgi:signal transduction histidine kinase/CheY-like chemotaxis protein/integral membrane sensor domain MASE1
MTATLAHRNPRSLVRTALIVATYLCVFVILDLASRQFEELHGIVAWYPATGLTYALLLVFGARFIPVVTIALLIGSVFVYHMPQPFHLLLLWALIVSSIYGVAAAFLRIRVRLDWQLRKSRDVVWLVVMAVSVSALLAVLSVSSSALTSDMPRNEVMRAIVIWWIGETVGVLTITPFLLVHVMPLLKPLAERGPVRSPARRSFSRSTLSIIGQAFSIAFMFYWVFAARGLNELRPMYLITLPLIWIALDHGFRGVTTGVVVLNFGVMLAMWFLRLDLAHLGELQLLMIVNCVLGLLMGAVVTERKRAEEALRDSNEVFSLFIRHSPIYAYIKAVTPTESRVLMASDNYSEMIGPLGVDMVGKTMTDLFPAEFATKMAADDWAVVSKGEVLTLNEDLNGHSYTTIKFPIVHGNDTLVAGYTMDITDRKRAEAEKEALRAQLIQSQKMDAIGQLAGGVAHDFNNLLTGILGNAAIIRSDLPPSSPLVANLNAVETAARQAADLAKGLLTFSRRAVVAAVPLDMAAAVDATLAMLKQSLPATIKILRDVEEPAWSALADRSQITQVILNLAVNARDAMHGEGTLTICTRNEILGQEYVQNHPLARIGEFVHLSVADTGPGIPAEIRDHLFEPFHTTKPAGSGTGLGLSIVYGAVKQADGWVTAGTAIGGGTVFDIFLPRCLEEPSASGVAGTSAAGVCSGTVLVVEDEPVVSDVAQALLSRRGYSVLTAPDGASALRALQGHVGTIDLVLLDMTMPGMTTEEIVREIRAIDAHVPILLTSGYASGDTVNTMLKEGAVQGFMAKPYDLREMLDSVESLLAHGSSHSG